MSEERVVRLPVPEAAPAGFQLGQWAMGILAVVIAATIVWSGSKLVDLNTLAAELKLEIQSSNKNAQSTAEELKGNMQWMANELNNVNDKLDRLEAGSIDARIALSDHERRLKALEKKTGLGD